MRILITQRELVQRGGSEMVAVEVALELKQRGHEVAVYTQRCGALGQTLQPYGVPVKTQVTELPWTPEVIHGQHHLPTMAALCRFPEAPAIYYCHGVIPIPERAPLHPHIHVYAGMCSAIVDTMVTAWGIPKEKVAVIENFVNLRRFSSVRTPPERPRRALLFGNSAASGPMIPALESFCREQGLELDKLGHCFGSMQDRPEHVLPEYDVVFAGGKSALEAMACGCAVIPFVSSLAGELVTPENLSRWTATNFSPRLHSPAPAVNAAWLRDQLHAYDPQKTAEVTHQVRRSHDLQHAVNRLEATYQTALQKHSERPAVAKTGEWSELARYLEQVAADYENAVHSAQDRTRDLECVIEKLRDAERRLAEAHRTLASEQDKKSSLRKHMDELTNKLAKSEKGRLAAEARSKTIVSFLRKGPMGRFFLSRLQRKMAEDGAGETGPSKEKPTG